MKYCGQENLGEALHTALRKACDSKPTTAVYICIRLLPNDLWGEYLKTVHEYIRKGKVVTSKNIAEVLKDASLNDRRGGYDPGGLYVAERDLDRSKPGALRKLIAALPEKETAGRSNEEILNERRNLRQLFRCVLNTFEDGDWIGFSAYIFH